MGLGVHPRLASKTAGSGRGPWHLAKAKALSVGLSNAYFKSLGLPSLFEECQRNRLEPPCTDPYARRCGRGRRVTAAPMPMKRRFRKKGSLRLASLVAQGRRTRPQKEKASLM